MVGHLWWFVALAALLPCSTTAFMHSPPSLRLSARSALRFRSEGRAPGRGIPVSAQLEIKPSARIPRLPDFETANADTRIRMSKILAKGSVVDLILAQAKDSVADVSMHLGRDVEEAFSKFTKKGKKEDKPLVVVLGSGWGAHAFVKVVDTDKFDVVAVSPRPYFIFTPMLASSSVGTVEYRSITEPMRSSNPFVEYLEANAEAVDAEKRVVRCKSARGGEAFDVQYDYLVVSVGQQINTFGVPGVRENCYFLKDVEDARSLRSAIVNQFEAASLPNLTDEERAKMLTFVVVGGGPTGVEFSGELFDFLRQDIRKYYPRLVPFVKTKLLQSGGGLLEMFDKTMQDMALGTLLREGVEVSLNARVKEITPDEIRLDKAKSDGTATESRIPYGLCVWATGNGPRPLSLDLIKEYQGGLETRGRIMTDPWLRMVGVKEGNVFSMGDCAAQESGALPQTAQVAAQQGAYVAHLLNQEVGNTHLGGGYNWNVKSEISRLMNDGDEVATALGTSEVVVARPFEFLSLGILAYIGDNKALAQVEVSSGSKEGSQMVSFNQGGWAGWILWRSVYITKQVAFRNRVLVLFDWAKSRVFGRDIACL